MAHIVRKHHAWLVLSSDGMVCATGGDEPKIDFWDVKALSKLTSIVTQAPDPSMQFAPGTHVLLYRTKTGFASYDADKKRKSFSATLKLKGEVALRCTDDGKNLVVADLDNDTGLYVWRWETGHTFKHVPLDRQITQLPLTSTGDFLVQTVEFRTNDKGGGLFTQMFSLDLASRHKEMLFEVPLGDRLMAYKFCDPQMSVACMHMSGAKPMDLFAGDNTAPKKYLSCGKGQFFMFDVTPNGHTLITAGDDGIVRVWKLSSAN